MIIHKCDVCGQVASQAKTAKIDSRECDFCEKCYAATVGKLAGKGRYVWELVTLPWWIQPQPWQPYYYTIPNTGDPLPISPTITCETTTTPAANKYTFYRLDGSTYTLKDSVQ